MGRFNLGSTVIVLAPGNVRWESTLTAGTTVQVGQAMGRTAPPAA
jgi:phosphatidylserine decarboxylase